MLHLPGQDLLGAPEMQTKPFPKPHSHCRHPSWLPSEEHSSCLNCLLLKHYSRLCTHPSPCPRRLPSHSRPQNPRT